MTVTLDLNYRQIKKAVHSLPTKDRVRLIRDLQKNTWQEQFRQLWSEISRRRKKLKMSTKEIQQEIENARQEFHDRRH